MGYFKRLFYFILLLSLSCSRGVIQERELVQILSEIYKADRFINSNYRLVLASDTTKVFETILNEYNYSNQDFTHTIEYYLTRPQKLKKIYQEAKLIVKEEAEMVERALQYERKLDSIAKPLLEIQKRSYQIEKLYSERRALRWILAPTSYPNWQINLSDSLQKLYETPQLTIWWTNNFKEEYEPIKIILKDEKASRTIPIPAKFQERYPERDDYIKR